MDKGDQKSKDYHTAIKNVVDHLKFKRSELQDEINCDEVEKAEVLGEMSKLQDRLSILNANLKKKSDFSKEYDKAITQSEQHFTELIQKSEDFLSLTRREALALTHAVCDSPSLCKNSKRSTQEPAPAPKKTHSSPPDAVLAIQPPDSNCISCSNAAPCTTIMVPYRANGL